MHHSYGNKRFYGANYQMHDPFRGFNQGSTHRTSMTKAYINPRIINYKYVQRSLSQNSLPKSNEIHFNPNFKAHGFISETNQMTNQQLSINQRLPSTTNAFLRQPAKKLDGSHEINSPKFREQKQSVKTPIVKLTSKYKVVNKRHLTSNDNHCSQKFTWLKENKIKQISNKFVKTNYYDNVTHKIMNKNTQDLSLKNKYRFVADKVASNGFKHVVEAQEKNNPPVFLSKMKFIDINSKKLINRTVAKSVINVKPVKRVVANKSVQLNSKYNYNKSKVTLKAANLVKNKYKYFGVTNNVKISKYKLDKRKKLPSASSRRKNVIRKNDIRNLFPAPYYRSKKHFHPIYSKFMYRYHLKQRHSFFLRKNQADIKKKPNDINQFQNKRVVKIGGMLYKSTLKKLTIAKSSKEMKPSTGGKNKAPQRHHHIVYVRGEKFLLDKNGKTLVRQGSKRNGDTASHKKLNRVDIGGVTYLQKSQNVLIRTRVHEARLILSQAKHKSIATLCKLNKKSALPCMIYHKFGKCLRHTKGQCMYKHDPRNIALCKKFLKGECTDFACLLSHEAIEEKMATCSFFLNGCCRRENCLFLHVKLNRNVAICQDFLHGFCNLGQNCTKRHVFQCPQYEKHEICKLGAKCPYPHKSKESASEVEKVDRSNDGNVIRYTVKKFKSSAESKIGSRINLKGGDGKDHEKSEKKRKKGKKKSISISSLANMERSPIDVVECVLPKRIKLVELPSFIPLNAEE